MLRYYTFGTDNRLLVNAWDKDASKMTGIAPVDALGRKYYMVLPRIFLDNRDAVLQVLRSGKPLTLKGHYFNSITGPVKSDVEIIPVKEGNGKARGATVKVITYPAQDSFCSPERLIDTGKTATAFLHGVRNPLNAIKGAVIYLRGRYPKESTLLDFTNIIEEEIQRLDDFISRFLSRSVFEMELSEMDVNGLLKKIEVFTSLQARSRELRFSYTYGELPAVLANSFQIEQAVLNVVNNAIEALRPGEEFRVSTSFEEKDGNGFVVIEVSDSGPGIKLPDTADDISVPLKKNKGRGFGLLITREILKQNGGHIEITSTKGKGTVVRMYLPARGCRTGAWD
jgi:two-component system nitrogen regulation sensor histidine kinase GlnL